MGCADGLRCTVLGVPTGGVLTWALVGARIALHPGVALGKTVLERFRAAAEGLREGTGLVVVALGLNRVLRAVVVLLLEALVILSLVTSIAALVFKVSVVTGSGSALVVVLRSALALIDVHVATLLVVGCRMTVALNPDIAVFLYMTRRRTVTLDPDFPVNVRCVRRLRLRLGLRLGRFLVDVDVDMSFLLGLGLMRLLVRLQSSQVAEHRAETGLRDVELLLSVLQLLLLAEQPVDAVPDTDTATVLDIASDALRVRRDVLESAAHIAHASVDPFGLLRVGFEDVVDLADGEKTSHFIKVGLDAANDAHIDCIGRTDVADAFGLVEEFGKLVSTSKGTSGSTEGENLSFNHDGRCEDSSRELPAR
jgi:hypothetical protein